MVTAIDENGKIRLSRQAVLEGWTPEEALEHDKGGKPGGNRPSETIVVLATATGIAIPGTKAVSI